MVNFVWSDCDSIIIMTNKVILNSELQMIKNYIKNTDYISANGVKAPRLPQSKSYLKIKDHKYSFPSGEHEYSY